MVLWILVVSGGTNMAVSTVIAKFETEQACMEAAQQLPEKRKFSCVRANVFIEGKR